MTVNALVNRYMEDSVASAPKERLILMLYDGALRNLNQALRGWERSDRAGFGIHLGKGQAIVSELLNSLDHEAGGKIAKNLERLYVFIVDRLMDSNLHNDTKGVQESIRILRTLKEGWDYAINQGSGQYA